MRACSAGIMVISTTQRVYRLSTKNTGDKAVRLSLLTVGNAKEIRRSGLVQRRVAAPCLLCFMVTCAMWAGFRRYALENLTTGAAFGSVQVLRTSLATIKQADIPQHTCILRLLLAINPPSCNKKPRTFASRGFCSLLDKVPNKI